MTPKQGIECLLVDKLMGQLVYQRLFARIERRLVDDEKDRSEFWICAATDPGWGTEHRTAQPALICIDVESRLWTSGRRPAPGQFVEAGLGRVHELRTEVLASLIPVQVDAGL